MTRHNVGMMVLDNIAKELSLSWRQHRPWKSMIAETTMYNYSLTLLKPQKLMNISGVCVAKAVQDLKIPYSQLYVFHDDLQRELGKLSLKLGGSANGHNGVKSIIECLGTNDFRRVRVGIGRPQNDDRSSEFVANYVLDKFTPDELEILREQVFPLLDSNGRGLELLCCRGVLWVKPKPRKTTPKSKPEEESTTQYDGST